jgi:hypothetical protein
MLDLTSLSGVNAPIAAIPLGLYLIHELFSSGDVLECNKIAIEISSLFIFFYLCHESLHTSGCSITSVYFFIFSPEFLPDFVFIFVFEEMPERTKIVDAYPFDE